MKLVFAVHSILVLLLIYFKLSHCRACGLHSQYEETTECRQLYEALEKAVVTDQNNIFQLKNFFSIYNTDILYINYNVIQIDAANSSEISAANSSELANITTFVYRTGYSKFGLFYIVNPQLLNSLMSGLYFGCEIRATWINITLNMANSTLQGYTKHDVEKTLDMITTRVSNNFLGTL